MIHTVVLRVSYGFYEWLVRCIEGKLREGKEMKKKKGVETK